jgi:hypothetical protein
MESGANGMSGSEGRQQLKALGAESANRALGFRARAEEMYVFCMELRVHTRTLQTLSSNQSGMAKHPHDVFLSLSRPCHSHVPHSSHILGNIDGDISGYAALHNLQISAQLNALAIGRRARRHSVLFLVSHMFSS